MASRFAAVLFVVSALLTSGAHADAEVRVRVESSSGQVVDGRVTLESSGDSPKRFTCTTREGQCTLKAVPGGQYLVVFAPAKGTPTKPRKVMIPPDGQVKLRVAAN